MTPLELGDLQLGPKLGSGAQGTLFVVRNADDLDCPPFPFEVIYKQFHSETRVAGASLDLLAQFSAQLDENDRQVIDALTVWPCVTVRDGTGRACGYLMQRIPDRFFQHIETTTGSEHIPREIQQLFQGDAIARRNLGETANRVERMAVAREAAFAIGFLHKRDFVYGDLSYKNAVFCLRPHPGIMLLDCDAVRQLGQAAAVPQLNSPGWKPPEGGVQSKATDRYKLGLLVLRCMTPGVNAQNRDAEKASGVLDPAGMSLLRRALGDNPAERTTGREWVKYFNVAIAAAGGVRERTGASPSPRPVPIRRGATRDTASPGSWRATALGQPTPAGFVRSRGGALQPRRGATHVPKHVWSSTTTQLPVWKASVFANPAGAPPPWSTLSRNQQGRSGTSFEAGILLIAVMFVVVVIGVLAATATSSKSPKSRPASTTTKVSSRTSSDESTVPPAVLQAAAREWSESAAGAANLASTRVGDSSVWKLGAVSTAGSLNPAAPGQSVQLNSSPQHWVVEFFDARTGLDKGSPLEVRTFVVRNTRGRSEVTESAPSETEAAASPMPPSWESDLDRVVSVAAHAHLSDRVRMTWACDPGRASGDCRWRFEFLLDNGAQETVWVTAAGLQSPTPSWA